MICVFGPKFLLACVALFLTCVPDLSNSSIPNQVPSQGAHHGSFGEHNEVVDQQHLKEHLKEQIDVNKGDMNEEQMQFYYFNMHDLNKDNKLDGQELIKAMTAHDHADGTNPPSPMSDESLEQLVDKVLENTDMDDDGYIVYPEFLRMQTKRPAGTPPI